MDNIKKDFPIFNNNPDLVYLDSAATSQKPFQVIKAVSDFYTHTNSNVHRGIYALSQTATDLYENSRTKVANFIGSRDPAEIIFTGNASEAINLVAYGYAKKFLKKGDTIVLTETEHHSNFVPWLMLKEALGVNLFFIPLDKNFNLDYQTVLSTGISLKSIKLVALTHVSNVLGTINPIAEIIAYYKKHGVNAKYLIDGAQSIPHLPISVKDLDCDFLAFSSHKMLGPSGVGVLWAKKEILASMAPLFVGSHMISSVTKDKAVWAAVPDKFEIGTGRLEGVVGLAAAIDYLEKLGWPVITKLERNLTEYFLEKFSSFKEIKLHGSKKSMNRLGVFSFNLEKVHSHDVSEILNRYHICIRSGHHCAQPLMQVLQVPATVRASLYIYNTKLDIDKLFSALAEVNKVFHE